MVVPRIPAPRTQPGVHTEQAMAIQQLITAGTLVTARQTRTLPLLRMVQLVRMVQRVRMVLRVLMDQGRLTAGIREAHTIHSRTPKCLHLSSNRRAIQRNYSRCRVNSGNSHKEPKHCCLPFQIPTSTRQRMLQQFPPDMRPQQRPLTRADCHPLLELLRLPTRQHPYERCMALVQLRGLGHQSTRTCMHMLRR